MIRTYPSGLKDAPSVLVNALLIREIGVARKAAREVKLIRSVTVSVLAYPRHEGVNETRLGSSNSKVGSSTFSS